MEDALFGNKRVFSRLSVKLPLRFFNLRAKSWRLAKACDIGPQGIGLLAKEQLSPNTPLEMWLSIPHNGESVYARGNVVWSKAIDESTHRIGVELDKADFVSRFLEAI